MSYTQVSAGDLIKASIANANWRHMGRADLSSFYPMDIDGNYSAQALGETGKEWTTGKFTGDITTAADINAVDGNFSGGINTDGKETVKFDVMTVALSTDGSGNGSATLAHGKSTNIRGVSNGVGLDFVATPNSTLTTTVKSSANTYSDDIFFAMVSGPISRTVNIYCIVYYV